jgi:pimeloyl-ACP methyl ester carboxylesterase
LFNYHGQSHTIYEKQSEFRPNDFAAILDKLLYRLSAFPNQLNIITTEDSIKLIGMGYGGYLAQSFMSLCPETFSLIKGVLFVNTSPYCSKKYR